MEEGKDFQRLHLHTLDSLCNDLIGGHSVAYGVNSKLFHLEKESRSILRWYNNNRFKWGKNLQAADVQLIVDEIHNAPPEIPISISASDDSDKKLLSLVRVEAHRFAGIHAYGGKDDAPRNFVFEPSRKVSLFEGANGSGKTSLINAIVWCLTGEILRPQRPPESGELEFEIEIDREDGIPTLHDQPPVTPLPGIGSFSQPDAEKKIPVDTWVKLTFEDQHGELLPPLKRAISRNARGKIEEKSPDFLSLNIDPISYRIGTTMPALLPFIRVGEKSEIGSAVAELTGLSSLISLSKHAEKVSKKISNDFRRKSVSETEKLNQNYGEVRVGLTNILKQHPSISPESEVPNICGDDDLISNLEQQIEHFEHSKSRSFENVTNILGTEFDAQDQTQIRELESTVGSAISKLDDLKELPSTRKLSKLSSLEIREIEATRILFSKIVNEANTLYDLSRNPEIAQRSKLYARVADWFKEFSIDTSTIEECPVCSTDITNKQDVITGLDIRESLSNQVDSDSELLSKSLENWVNSTIGVLSAQLPNQLREYVDQDLPDHPIELMKSSFGDELFSSASFRGVLSLLQSNMNALFSEAFSGYQRLEPFKIYELPAIGGHNAKKLQASINRVNRALCFAEWRTSNFDECLKIFHQIIGAKLKISENVEQKDIQTAPLRNRLIMLLDVTASAQPISECIKNVSQIIKLVKRRRENEALCRDYDKTVQALKPIQHLGLLAAQQVNDLQDDLQVATEQWRDSLYRNAYSKSGHSLAKTAVAPEGELSISVGSHKTVAPAQHVSNASALRASLFGFYLAFWERVLRTRGGFKLMILDDPQEMLDEENEARLADTIEKLAKGSAQLLVTTHDQKFAKLVSREGQATSVIEHRSIHPVNIGRHTIEVPLAYQDLTKKRQDFIGDRDNMSAARDYLSECRVYIEARLTDFFDDPAYVSKSPKPALSDHIGHARHLLKNHANNELFKTNSFRQFCDDPSLRQGSPCLARLNESHHANKRDIMPADVCEIEDDLERLVKLADALHIDFRLWRRRDEISAPTVSNRVVRLNPIATPNMQQLPIYQDLAAFTEQAPAFSQEVIEDERIGGSWFSNKALFFLRNDMFGYSAPAGSIAIVEVNDELLNDQSLVIAKYKNKYLARRLLRSNKNSSDITLATVSTDPRMRPPTIVTSAHDVELYRVVGFLFNGTAPAEMNKKNDAVPIQDTDIFKKIKSCYQVKGVSAEPLALDGQLVLGGDNLSMEELSSKQGSFVAMSISDGGGIFKRIGDSLPGNLKHLIQLESIGGRGSSMVVSVSDQSIDAQNVRSIISARSIVGIVYELE